MLNSGTRDVELSDFTQGIEISINRGDIDLRPGRLPLSKMDVRTQSGNIDLSLPKGAKFELKAATQRGEVENGFGSQITSENTGRGQSLQGSVGGGPLLTLNTNRGSVTVRRSDSEETSAGTTRVPPPPKPPKEPLPKAENQ